MTTSDNSALLLPGKEFNLWWDNILVTFKVTSEETDGTFAIVEEVVPSNYATPLHVHCREDERVYVVSGNLMFQVGDEIFGATTGAFINMPRGLVHNYKNVGNTEAVLLITYSPGGIEDMFCEIGRPVINASKMPPNLTPLEMENLVAIAAQYGIEIKPPALKSTPNLVHYSPHSFCTEVQALKLRPSIPPYG